MSGPAGGGGLKRDFVAISVGHGAFALGQWAVAAALAKLAGVEAMAAFGLALAIGGPVYFLANMALRTALARDAAGEFAFADYWRTRLATTALAGGVMVAAALLLGPDRGLNGVTAILLFAAIKSADAGFDLIYGRRQRDGEARKVAASFILRALFAPAACVLGLLASGGALWGGLLGLAFAASLLLLATEARPLAASLAAEPRRRGGVAVARRAWPLGVGAALAALETAIPRFAVDGLLAPDALGYFTGVFLFFHALVVLAGALGSAATPHLARAFAARNKGKFLEILGILIGMGAVIGCAGVAAAWLLGPWALALAYTPAFADQGDLLVLVMAAAGLRVVAGFLQYALAALGRFKAHMAAHIGLALLAGVTAPPFVAAYGLDGAAYCLLTVAGAQLLVVGLLLARRMDWRDA